MTEHDGGVLAVAANPEFRAWVTHLLSRIGCGIREASSGEEALDLARQERPGCVVLDVPLPGVNGYAVCQELRSLFGENLTIIFVSGDRTEPADRVAGLLLGADDYVTKPFDPEEFVARVRRGLARAQRPSVDTKPAAGLAELTGREQEVLGLLAEGRDQAAISDQLFISPTTVSTHIQRILSKLGVHSRAQAVAVAHLEKLVELPVAHADVTVTTHATPVDWTRTDGSRSGPVARYAVEDQPDRRPRRAVVLETLRGPKRVIGRRIARAPQEPPAAFQSEPASDLLPLRPDVAVVEGPSNGSPASGERQGQHEPDQTDSWWLDPATPKARISAATGQLTNISNESTDFMSGTPDELVGRHFLDFVLPQARADASSFFDLVRQLGEIRSKASVRQRDGTMVTIEFRAAVQGDSIDVAYRPLHPDAPPTE